MSLMSLDLYSYFGINYLYDYIISQIHGFKICTLFMLDIDNNQ